MAAVGAASREAAAEVRPILERFARSEVGPPPWELALENSFFVVDLTREPIEQVKRVLEVLAAGSPDAPAAFAARRQALR